MPENIAAEMKAQLIQWLARHPGVRRIVLFGSRARGTGRERSDVDFAVEAPGMPEEEWAQAWADVAYGLDTLLRIDVGRLDQVSVHLRESVDREGVVLYARGA
ncbi:MAG: nucleotidyltransferase domain-containing protein [Thermaerobacter sp.]|nr:nucleotidyltransferase domain-containing protein [Thermaerobacter sp.]